MRSTDTTDQLSQWLLPTAVFDGKKMLNDTAVEVGNGIVSAIKPIHEVPDTVTPLHGILTPGFFDIQVNGGGNVLFNTSPTAEGAKTIAMAHREFGTTHILPTVISDTPDVITAACDAIVDCAGENGIAGIHVEGPHISTVRAGTHDKARIRLLDNNTIGALEKTRSRNIPTLITVAPEAVSPGQIKALVAMGVIVSLGHSDASAEQIKPCLEEGAQLFTHLFNAMSPMQGRAPGMVGTAINSDVYCSIIGDGKHVSAEMIQLAWNARPRKDRMILISDAMPTVGGNPEFELYGEKIRVADNSLINANGSLAGAHITIAQSIAYLLTHTTLNIENCLQMSITHPAELLGLTPLATLESMPVQDCIILAEDGSHCTSLPSAI